MRAHLELMSKPRLIALIANIERRAQANADLADYWRAVTTGLIATAPKPDFAPSPETTLAEAKRILRSLPPDPHAVEHRETLRAALNHGGRAPLPGTRCERPTCRGRRLNEHGLCSHCQPTQTRNARSAA